MSSMDIDAVTAQQIKIAQQFDVNDRKNETLVRSLKQACSRNKAIEKVELWKEKHVQDHGSKSSISLKSADGEVTSLPKVPDGAQVTVNDVNLFENERKANATVKEDSQLSRFCDGQDTAWRPDSFFTEVCGQQEVPPWPIRPTELFTNPHLHFRIMALQMARKKAKKQAKKLKRELEKGVDGAQEGDDVAKEKKKKKEKKERKEKGKKSKKEKKGKKEKKEKKGKKEKKEKKSKKEKKEPGSPKRKEPPSSDEEEEEEGDEPAITFTPANGPAITLTARAAAAPKPVMAAEDLSKRRKGESSEEESSEESGEEEAKGMQEVDSDSQADWESE